MVPIEQYMYISLTESVNYRLLADGHVPWACEGFLGFMDSNLLVQNPSLLRFSDERDRCLCFLMIKLWNQHSLLDSRGMNTCNTILDWCEEDSSQAMCTRWMFREVLRGKYKHGSSKFLWTSRSSSFMLRKHGSSSNSLLPSGWRLCCSSNPVWSKA